MSIFKKTIFSVLATLLIIGNVYAAGDKIRIGMNIKMERKWEEGV